MNFLAENPFYTKRVALYAGRRCRASTIKDVAQELNLDWHAYFHGGLSPQELIIPVVTMSPTAQAKAGPPTGINWTLVSGTPKLTTRFFSVQITGQQSGSSLFDVDAPKVRVEIRARGKCVSRPVSASYGFEDGAGEVQLRATRDDSKKIEPNTVTMMLIDEISQNAVSVVLLDASSGVELATLGNLEVAISF